MARIGRRNITAPIDEATFQKISTVSETSCPRRLLVESLALTAARKQGVYVPKVIDYSLDANGREKLLLERIEGMCLNEKNDEVMRANCMFEVGRQLRALENIALRFGWIESSAMLGSHESWSEFILDYVGKYADRLVNAELLNFALAQKLMKLIRETDINIPYAALVNRDLKWGNLIVDNSGKVAIVDWENAILGDSLYDIAIFGVREGHSLPWRELARGFCAETSSRRYSLYEAVALIGVTEYHRRYETDARLKANLLSGAIEKF